MAKDYVEQHDEGYWITGTRVSLDSVVYAFLEGLSPESIVDSFDTLTLEEVYGAIAFDLGHRDVIDAYLKQSEASLMSSAVVRVKPILCCTRSWTKLVDT